MVSSTEEITLARDTLIFFLQGLGFLINIQKSVFQPCHVIQFLGIEIDSVNMTLGLPQKKKEQIVQQCQSPLRRSSVTIRELNQLIGRLTATVSAVLPAPLQYRIMQRQQILGLSTEENNDSLITLTEEVKGELNLWVQKLSSNKKKDLSFSFTKTSNSMRCVFKRMGSLLSGTKNWGILESFGKEILYKYFGTECCEIHNFDFYLHVSKGEINSYSNEQNIWPFLLVKMGGT